MWSSEEHKVMQEKTKKSFFFRFLGISLENTRLVKIFMVKKTRNLDIFMIESFIGISSKWYH
jgi:hypothetical protein